MDRLPIRQDRSRQVDVVGSGKRRYHRTGYERRKDLDKLVVHMPCPADIPSLIDIQLQPWELLVLKGILIKCINK